MDCALLICRYYTCIPDSKEKGLILWMQYNGVDIG